MIQVKINRDSSQIIQRVLIQGHAGFAEHGSDIVCAAVSAIAIGMVNSIEKLFQVVVCAPPLKEGTLDCQIPAVDPIRMEKITLLFEVMVYSLKLIAEEYPQYIKIMNDND